MFKDSSTCIAQRSHPRAHGRTAPRSRCALGNMPRNFTEVASDSGHVRPVSQTMWYMSQGQRLGSTAGLRSTHADLLRLCAAHSQLLMEPGSVVTVEAIRRDLAGGLQRSEEWHSLSSRLLAIEGCIPGNMQIWVEAARRSSRHLSRPSAC